MGVIQTIRNAIVGAPPAAPPPPAPASPPAPLASFVAGPNALDVLARTAWGEARNQGVDGMRAICFVAINRARQFAWWGQSVAECCTKPWQFSCWNSDDPNRVKLATVTEADPQFKLARGLAAAALAGTITDNTGGADHYYERHLAPPDWTLGSEPTVTIGNHIFYKIGPMR